MSWGIIKQSLAIHWQLLEVKMTGLAKVRIHDLIEGGEVVRAEYGPILLVNDQVFLDFVVNLDQVIPGDIKGV